MYVIFQGIRSQFVTASRAKRNISNYDVQFNELYSVKNVEGVEGD